MGLSRVDPASYTRPSTLEVQEAHLRRLRIGSTRAGVAVLAVAGLVLSYFAVAHRGVEATEMQLNDGGVWVTNGNLRQVAHLNYPSRTLDGGLSAVGGNPGEVFDISQEARDVLVSYAESGHADAVDTARLVYSTKAQVPEGMTLVHGGPNVAVLDPSGGRVWAMSIADVSRFSPETEPSLKGAAGVRGLVTRSGIVHTVDASGHLRTLRPAGSGWQIDDAGNFSAYDAKAEPQLSLVGEELVAFDPKGHRLFSRHGERKLADNGLLLQQPGPAADAVVLVGPATLLRVPLSDAAETRTAVASGQPTAPVVVGGCTYAAWSGSGAYVRDCPGSADDISRTVDKLAGATDLVFRVNRSVVVINDISDGSVFLPDDNFTVVENWQDISQQIESQEKGNDAPSEEVVEKVDTERSKDNHPPTAVNDDFGVRAGRATKLPVLVNDSDPDGDLITASVAKSPRLGKLAQIRGGEALQITIPEGATGAESLTYLATDGRGGEDEAVAKISIHPESVNGAPKIKRESRLVLAAGHEGSYNVLPDWLDPDGDDVILGGVADVDGLQIRWRPDGLVTIRDVGGDGAARKVEVIVTMTDGRSNGSAEGSLTVDIRSKEKNQEPTANADHIRVAVGADVVVSPMTNDTDPESDPLRLAMVGAAGPGARLRKDLSAGTFTISSTKPGTVYIPYDITDGPNLAHGVVRLDVIEVERAAAPVTDNDLALLPAGGSVLVDVLANDDDPNGGVLVVQSTEVAADLGISVEVLDHFLLRITAPSGLTRTVSFAYTVSNGTGAAQGQVTVVPLAPVSEPEPPVAKDDVGVVRAGDVITVPVLGNDTSPAGLDLSVSPEHEVIAGQDLGEFFVSENTVRFKAGGKAGRARATYTIRDARGNFASADVILTIRGLAEKNAPPEPKPLIARLVGGSQVGIAVPTDGIDPNGDSVTLLGIETPPGLGTATVEKGKIVFRAALGVAGTDSFTYAVADRFGAKATGTVQVGIAPPATGNQLPVALADTLTARPGVELALPVTANDFDGDGDPLTLGSVQPVDKTTTTPAKADGQRVWLTTPENEATLLYYYDIADGRGGTARGALTVEVTKTAPLLPPIARDDIVDLTQVIGKESVAVEVLGNDEDPDGVSDKLTVTIGEPGIVVDKGTLTIPVKEDRQVLVYTVTDKDDLTAKAVVIVPGIGREAPKDDPQQEPPGPPPTLRSEKLPVRVKAGAALRLPLDDYVSVRDGHSPRLTFEKNVHVGPGADGSSLVADASTLTFTSAKDFGGDTSLTFEVTDGKSADDPAGLRATLTIPIVVEATKNSPPVFQPSPVIVEAGGPKTTVDLRPMATDPDPDDQTKLTFTLTGAPGIGASLSGSTLTASAPLSVEPGTAVTAKLTVSDGTNPPVDASLTIQVVATTKPMMTTRDAEVEAKAGEPTTVDIAAYVTNPFAAEGKPITLVGRPTIAGDGALTGATGTEITVTPGGTFHGQLTVTYRVGDATGRPERQVDGRILLTVRARPDPPTNVFAETKASRTASVSWTPGPANGAPITGFTVKWAGGSKTFGQVTSGTITELKNDTEYSFTVTATNDVGESEPSKPSPKVRPDVRPDAPAAPTATFGDRQVALTWTEPHTDGSAILYYTVEISPPAGGSAQQKATGTSYTWTGLTNGTAYQFRVRAHSNAVDPSDFGPYSSAEIPAGPPATPAAPTAKGNGDKTLPPSAAVSWAAPNGNGDDAMTYEVRLTGGSTLYTGSALSSNFNLTVGTSAQTFQVRATNKAGTSDWSAASNGVRPFMAPGAPTGVRAEATGNDNEVRISFTPGAANGALPGEITYAWAAGGRTGTLPAGGGLVRDGAFVNGNDVGVTVTATAHVDGTDATGTPSASAVANAYGPPRVPSVSASGNINNVTLRWEAGATTNGRPIEAVQIQTADGVFDVPVNGSRDEGNGRSQERWIKAQVKAGGIWSGWSNMASARTWEPPYSSTRHNGDTPCPRGVAGPCRKVEIALSRWDPGRRVHCWVPGVSASSWNQYRAVDGNGNAGWDGVGREGQLFDTDRSPIPDGDNTIDCDYG